MATVFLVAALLLSYLLGSIPAAYLVGKARGVDLRRVGSGNLGATNVVRNVSKPLGIAVFVFDFFKGLAPVLLGGWLLVGSARVPWSRDVVAITLGVAAMLGHCFPVWLGFRGGKGVATSAGFLTGICWPPVVIVLALWYVTLRVSKFVSVASMVAALAFPVVFILHVGVDAAFGDRRLVTVLAFVLALAIVVLHRSNISRLLRGEEDRVDAARSGEESQ